MLMLHTRNSLEKTPAVFPSPCIQIMTSMVFSAWVQVLRVDENPLNPAALPWGDVGGTSEVFKHSYELQAPAQVRDCRSPALGGCRLFLSI